MSDQPMDLFINQEHAHFELEPIETDYSILSKRELDYARVCRQLILHKAASEKISTFHLEGTPYNDGRKFLDDIQVTGDIVSIIRQVITERTTESVTEISLSDTKVTFNRDGVSIDVTKGDVTAFEASAYISKLMLEAGLRLS